MNKPIRHGENLLLPVEKLPRAKRQHLTTFIVGHSETGHHHVLEATKSFDVILSSKQKTTFLELIEEATLTHKKSFDRHADLTIAPGKYMVVRKTEYDPWSGLIREVFD